MNDTQIDQLLDRRIVVLEGIIGETQASQCIAKMLFLAHRDPKAPVTLWVNSPGGLVTASIAILQTMDELACPVRTHCIGLAAGTAAVIVGHGQRGFRSAGCAAAFGFTVTASGPTEDSLEIELRQFDQLFVETLAEDTCSHEQEILSLIQRKAVLSATEARNLRLIDAIPEPDSGSAEAKLPVALGWIPNAFSKILPRR